MDKYDKKCTEVDNFFLKVAEEMTNQPTIWNSLDLQMYLDYGGDSFDRKQLVNSLLDHLKGRCISFHMSGYAKLLCFKVSERNV